MNVTVLIGQSGKSYTSNQLIAGEYDPTNSYIEREVFTIDDLKDLIREHHSTHGNCNLYLESQDLTYDDIKDLDFIDRIIICKHK